MRSAISDTEATELMRKAYRLMRNIDREERTAEEQLADAQRAGLYMRMVDLHYRITERRKAWEHSPLSTEGSTSPPR